jgi:hypothetical protein
VQFPLGITRLERFYGNGRGVVPKSFPDFAELSMTQFAHKFERCPVDLPLVTSIIRHACRHRFFDLSLAKMKKEWDLRIYNL